MSIAMKEYRLPEPLVAFLKSCRLHGLLEVTTGLQHQRVTVSLAWDLRTPAPTRPKKTVQPPTARQQQEQPLRHGMPPQPTPINIPTATIGKKRQPHQLQCRLRQWQDLRPSQPLLKNDLRPRQTSPTTSDRRSNNAEYIRWLPPAPLQKATSSSHPTPTSTFEGM